MGPLLSARVILLFSLRQRGFTVLELLVVVLIISIVLFSSWYGMAGFFVQGQLASTKKQLLSALSYARQYAVLHHRAVLFCGSGGDEASGCDGRWSKGWQLMSGNEITKTWRVRDPDVRIVWRGSFGRRDSLVFDSLGYPSGSHGRFELGLSGYPGSQQVILSPSGVVR